MNFTLGLTSYETLGQYDCHLEHMIWHTITQKKEFDCHRLVDLLNHDFRNIKKRRQVDNAKSEIGILKSQL